MRAIHFEITQDMILWLVSRKKEDFRKGCAYTGIKTFEGPGIPRVIVDESAWRMKVKHQGVCRTQLTLSTCVHAGLKRGRLSFKKLRKVKI